MSHLGKILDISDFETELVSRDCGMKAMDAASAGYRQINGLADIDANTLIQTRPFQTKTVKNKISQQAYSVANAS